MLRGNHECRQITQVYGFYGRIAHLMAFIDECMNAYSSPKAWRTCCQVFDYMSIAAVSSTVFSSRLSKGAYFVFTVAYRPIFPRLINLEQLGGRKKSPRVAPCRVSICFECLDILWSDPEELETGLWALSPRGAGFLFGSKVTMEFNWLNDLTKICRAHQLVNEGYKIMFDEESLVTVWSAPNYCYRCGNVAAVLNVDESAIITDDSFVVFDSSPLNESMAHVDQQQRMQRKMYFD